MRMPAQKSVRYAMFGLLYLAQGAILSYFTALNALYLLSIAASMFAILMAIANIGTGVGLAIGGVLADAIGYQWTFVVVAFLNLLALPLIPSIFPRGRRED
jgi:PAT family beta-lactamase induction signal transducer AmpG